MVVDCGADVTFKGEENISVFNSSLWAERGYCNKCGSHPLAAMDSEARAASPG